MLKRINIKKNPIYSQGVIFTPETEMRKIKTRRNRIIIIVNSHHLQMILIEIHNIDKFINEKFRLFF